MKINTKPDDELDHAISVVTAGSMAKLDKIPISVSDFIVENPSPIRQVYKIGKIIGNGSYGDVRHIIHRQSGVQRALKIVSKLELDHIEE